MRENPVDDAVGVPDHVERRAVQDADGGRRELGSCLEVSVVLRVVSLGREVRRDVGGVGTQRHWLREIYLLPAGGRFPGESGARQQLAVRGPQVADVRPGVGAAL